ncbi:MAG: hypothetical protein H6Q52_465 [Deltaproteobacteria bacterium]|nr:hypothetical protein [Deltaproteobacteria bacterium]
MKNRLPGKSLEVCSTVNGLALKLSEQDHHRKMAILVPENGKKLIDIFSMQSLFNGLPVVLVLPNKEKLAVAIGYRLKPRLTYYRESGIAEVVSGLLDTVNSLQLCEAC